MSWVLGIRFSNGNWLHDRHFYLWSRTLCYLHCQRITGLSGGGRSRKEELGRKHCVATQHTHQGEVQWARKLCRAFFTVRRSGKSLDSILGLTSFLSRGVMLPPLVSVGPQDFLLYFIKINSDQTDFKPFRGSRLLEFKMWVWQRKKRTFQVIHTCIYFFFHSSIHSFISFIPFIHSHTLYVYF